jgi:hypothetical protein
VDPRPSIQGRLSLSYRGLSRALGRAIVALGLAPVILGVLAGLAGDVFGQRASLYELYPVLALAWVLGLPLLWIASLFANRRYVNAVGTLRADPQGFTIERRGKARRIGIRSIASALMVPTEYGSHELEFITRAGRVFCIELPSRRDGLRILDALGFGKAGRRVASDFGQPGSSVGCFSLIAGVGALLVSGFLALLVGLAAKGGKDAGSIAVVLVSVAITLAIARRLEGKVVTVGTDGVRVASALRSRFFARAQIEDVLVTPMGIWLTLKSKSKVWLGENGPRQRALAKRITRELGGERGEEDVPPAVLTVLERGGRKLDDWRAGLRALVAGDGRYRAVRYDADELVTIARDADAPIDRRLGAAMAIHASADSAAREKLRILTEGLAGDRLRIAMDKAALGELDDEALEEALREARG